ncbi:MAG: type IV secretory system conjugative DNA transfer family protein [Oscillospiraceae bacterium]
MNMKKIYSTAALFLIALFFCTYLIGALFDNLMPALEAKNVGAFFNPVVLLKPINYLYGFFALVVLVVIYAATRPDSFSRTKKSLFGANKKNEVTDSTLENSRFMTDKERDFNFAPYDFAKLGESKKDGIPVRAWYDKKGLHVNLASPMHGLIIGATGSGKTTTFINPMIQILAKSGAGSSMICTDPKGELFQMHSKFLQDRGYKVMVLDLRDPYSSFRWNPLGDLYDRYQEYLNTGNEIYRRNDDVNESGLELVNSPDQYEDEWYEYEGKAYGVRRDLIGVIKVQRQKIFDEVYEDLNDLVSVICPIESKDDPVWEKGARSIIMATIIGMLEDSENPELGMTKEKFNFFNVNKALGNSDNNFEALRNYFYGRDVLSKAVTLSKQVLSAAENTLASYMSIAFDKLSIFNDEGICSMTSNTDIDPAIFADSATALFLKIPDEKDTRHTLAAAFILCIYKALIKKASTREDLSLPRNVYFILDEFGNMPKIDKFDKMITVGRSRKIWFNMVVQSYAQLDNVYGKTVGDIVKSNCGMKMFIGSNDIETCKEFSELCGNCTVSTTSVSRSMGTKEGEASYSTSIQTRPLIYPSELQKINNKTDTGNAIIVTFGNYPLKTKFTPSYRCDLYKFGTMDLTEVRSNAFFPDEVYYDLTERNNKVLGVSADAE